MGVSLMRADPEGAYRIPNSATGDPHSTQGASIGSRLRRARAWCERHGLLLSLAVACAARLRNLATVPLSLEETWSWYLTGEVLRTGDFRRTLTLGGIEAPLFDALNVLVAKIAGLSVLGLRGPQAVLGVAAVALVFVLVRRWHGARFALPVALLAAWSPYLVFYSREARPYSQLLFCTLVFTWAFEATRALAPRARGLALFACAVLALASHYYAVAYLAAFYVLTLAGHRRAGRQEALRADLRAGRFVLLALAPLLVLVLLGLGTLPVPFWQTSNVGLPALLVEQFLFLGTSLPQGGRTAVLINVVAFLLLVVPFVDALRRRSGLIGAEPVSSSLWWLAPALVAAAGLAIGQDLLSSPRNLVSSGPFLLVYWVLFTSSLAGPRWVRRLYAVVLLVPFALSGFLVASSHPGQAYLRGRDTLAAVVRDLAAYADEFDVMLVDHWWMAPFFSYYYAEPGKVWALGRDDRGEGGSVRDLDRLPADARVLLVTNDAALQSDSEGGVAEALRSRRRLIREIPCPHADLPGRGLVCSRMLLFGRAEPGGDRSR